MAVVVYEAVESRELVNERGGRGGPGGQGTSAVREYVLQSDDFLMDAGDVNDAVANVAPDFYLRLAKNRIRSKPMGGGIWRATVEYAPLTSFDHPEGGLPGGGQNIQMADALGMEFAFSTSGATQHITQSINTNGSYGCAEFGNEPPETGRAIGVSKNGVAGCDVAVPKFEITITRKLQILRMSYIHKLVDCTGTVNNGLWNTIEPFSALFLGAEGTPIETSAAIKTWTVTYRFLIGKKQTNIKIGGPEATSTITVPVKFAHDYLWVGYRNATDLVAGVVVQVPAFAKTENVYESRDFVERLEF